MQSLRGPLAPCCLARYSADWSWSSPGGPWAGCWSWPYWSGSSAGGSCQP